MEKLHLSLQKFWNDLVLPGSWVFNHAETLRRIDLYYAGKFKSGEWGADGKKKYFYNVGKPICDLAEYLIDIDTKDILILPLRAEDDLEVFILKKELEFWMKKHQFAQLLNMTVKEYPKYGTVVWKKTRNGIQKVPLHNLRLDVSANSLRESEFVAEYHRWTLQDLRNLGYKTTEVEARGFKEDEKIDVYEYYLRQPNGWKVYILADPFAYQQGTSILRSEESAINTRIDYLSPIVLDEFELDDLPYYELHWEKIPGRWLGLGLIELLFEEQVAINETINLQQRLLRLGSLKIYQTRDENIGGKNLIQTFVGGEVITTDEGIQPVDTTPGNIPAFNQNLLLWEKLARTKSFFSDVLRGEPLPSRTPLGVANLLATMSSSYFAHKRENYGIFLQEMFENVIIPSFIKEMDKERIFIFSGSEAEIKKLDKAIASILVETEAIRYAQKNGFFPSEEELEKAREKIINDMRKNGKKRFLKIPASFYNNIKYKVNVVITGENIDVASRSSSLITILQMLGSNPTLLLNPLTRVIIIKLLNMVGFSLSEFEEEEIIENEQITQQIQNLTQQLEKLPIQRRTTGISGLGEEQNQ